MIAKSQLRKAIDDVLEEHDLEDGNLATDLVDRIMDEFPVYDDEDEEDGEGPDLL
jgi:hypothetical protein